MPPLCIVLNTGNCGRCYQLQKILLTNNPKAIKMQAFYKIPQFLFCLVAKTLLVYSGRYYVRYMPFYSDIFAVVYSSFCYIYWLSNLLHSTQCSSYCDKVSAARLLRRTGIQLLWTLWPLSPRICDCWMHILDQEPLLHGNPVPCYRFIIPTMALPP